MKFPAALLLTGLVLLGVCEWLVFAHNWEPLQEAIALEPGQATTKVFSVDLDADYAVEIRINRFLPFDDLMKILAGAEFSCRVDDLQESSGSTFKGGKILIGPDYRVPHGFGSAGDDVLRTVGMFEGKKNHSYRITLNLDKHEEAFREGMPRLIVRESSHVIDGYVTVAQLLALPAFGLIGVGGLWLTASGISRLAKRRPNQAPEPTAPSGRGSS